MANPIAMNPVGTTESVLMLSPEPPYPLHGGGAYRTASLVHYFSRFADVDLILISDSGKPALLPPGLVRSQKTIALPPHSKGSLARYIRNSGRALRGVPPLIDRLSGLGPALAEALRGQRHDIGIIEHFWCAPYVDQIEQACSQTILDLHNIEAVLHDRCAAAGRGLVARGHRRFAAASRKLERELFPRFSLVLAASAADARRAAALAPSARIEVYLNSLPCIEKSEVPEQPVIVFSGNFEYHPNIDAVRFLVSEIWPELKKQQNRSNHAATVNPRLRLVGRGDRFIRHLLLPAADDIEVTGAVSDAFAEIAGASVVIAPLRAGSGTRIKILEAWAAARPVVATPLAAEGLETEDGRNIVLADNPPAFANAILRLLAEPGERRRLGSNGRHTFEQHYTWEAAWRMLEAAFPSRVRQDT
jgi:polysaccharide biosynthesis protein PslH